MGRSTTGTPSASGYQSAIFTDGVVFSSAGAGLVPLQAWWSQERNDWLTVASPEGVAYAKANNYTLDNATLGYVYATSPDGVNVAQGTEAVTPPTMSQWNRATSLLLL